MTEELATVSAPTTQLAIPQSAQVAQYVTQDDFDGLVSPYLPRLQLFDSNSKPVKKKAISAGNFGVVVNGNIQDLGEEFQCFVLSMRFKAMDLNDGIRSYYDPKNNEFLRIKSRSTLKDSGCMCGPEFLLYVPALTKFVTYFMASKTAKRESVNVKSQLGKACTLKSKLIETEKFSWYGPIATMCSMPLDPPPMDKLESELTKFNNPPVEEIETVEEEAKGGRAR